MKKIFAMLMIGLFFTGCAGMKTTAPVTVCNEFPGDSLIEKYIPDLRTANTLIKLSILEISRLPKIKKQDIVATLDDASAMADKSTYNDFFTYLAAKVKFIQQNMGAEVAIIGADLVQFQGVNLPISDKDRCYIKYQIQQDRDQVLPWIK